MTRDACRLVLYVWAGAYAALLAEPIPPLMAQEMAAEAVADLVTRYPNLCLPRI